MCLCFVSDWVQVGFHHGHGKLCLGFIKARDDYNSVPSQVFKSTVCGYVVVNVKMKFM